MDLFRFLRGMWIGYNEPVKNWPYFLRAYDEADRQQRMESRQDEIVRLLRKISEKRK
jgi:hypothetical protein